MPLTLESRIIFRGQSGKRRSDTHFKCFLSGGNFINAINCFLSILLCCLIWRQKPYRSKVISQLPHRIGIGCLRYYAIDDDNGDWSLWRWHIFRIPFQPDTHFLAEIRLKSHLPVPSAEEKKGLVRSNVVQYKATLIVGRDSICITHCTCSCYVNSRKGLPVLFQNNSLNLFLISNFFSNGCPLFICNRWI